MTFFEYRCHNVQQAIWGSFTRGKPVASQLFMKSDYDNQIPGVLQMVRLPARLTTSQAAIVLGMHADHIGWLVGAKLLNPLGGVAPGKAMYFASKEIEELALNVRWLNKASRVITARISIKNKNSDSRKVL